MNRIHKVGFLLVVLLSLASCDGIDNSVGYEVLPEYLKSKPISKEYKVKLRTVKAGTDAHIQNIYISSAKGYVGTLPNTVYGGIESGYLTQFYLPNGFRFKEEDIIQKIDSVRLNLYYDGVVGDTIANMQVQVNRLNAKLEHNKYSISDISSLIGESIGEKSYWAGRGTKKLVDSKGNAYGFMLSIPLLDELGDQFLAMSKAGDPIFANQKAFEEWFKGVYIHTKAGQGSVIRIYSTELAFYYTKEVEVTDSKTKTKKKVNKAFSQSLIHTSEVPQLSSFVNYGVEKLINDDKYAYVKAPNGVWPELTIPTREIVQTLKEAPNGYTRVLNSATFQIQGEASKSSSTSDPYKLDAPKSLLMLPKNRVEEFFEKERTENSLSEIYTSYIGELTIAGSQSYNFGNVGSLILDHIAKHPNEDLVVVLIPVERTTAENSNGGTTLSLSHLVLPSAVKFSINDQNTTLETTIIERKSGTPF